MFKAAGARCGVPGSVSGIGCFLLAGCFYASCSLSESGERAAGRAAVSFNNQVELYRASAIGSALRSFAGVWQIRARVLVSLV